MTLVAVTRGNIVESTHAGHVAVVDADNRLVFGHGDVGLPVFPRSAIKLLQALPLIETGAADAFALDDTELALACSSHSGEPAHVDAARSMLAKIGLDEGCLLCGGHWSLHQAALIEQARRFDRTPGNVCSNCSGKHSGFLAVCRHEEWPVADYVAPDHPHQRRLSILLEELTGTSHDERNRAIDGCSIPTYAVPLRDIACGMARAFFDRDGVPDERRAAAMRLARACMANAFYTAGTDRFCNEYMTAGGGAIYAKTGAEGVYCGVLIDQQLAIALKVLDGSARAAEVAFAAVANAFASRDDLRRFERRTLHNWAGIEVGAIGVTDELREPLLAATRARG